MLVLLSLTDNAFFQDIAFRKIDNDNGPAAFSTMTLASVDASMSSCFIIIGTKATDEKVATIYVVTPGSDEKNWRILSLQEDSTKVVKALAVTLRKPFYGCFAILYKQNPSSSDSTLDSEDVGTALSCSSTDTKQTYNITVYLDNIGGGARDVAMTVTPLNVSDLYVAGVKGIGYYASQILSKDVCSHHSLQ